MFCNWVHSKQKGYGIVSNIGKYLRFMLTSLKEEEKDQINKLIARSDSAREFIKIRVTSFEITCS